ncbi:MAG: hypothetical protein J0I41_20725 [Filimonas sp.]|nr:hypothetical protein [Filimonas sp.]
MYYGEKKIPRGLVNAVILYLLYCLLFTPNFLITVPVALFPLLAFRLFWVDKHPNVLFFGMMIQWMSASLQLLYCNVLRVTLEEKMRVSSFPAYTMEYATFLSIIALYFFSLGLFVKIRKLKVEDIFEAFNNYSARNILLAYIIFSAIVYFTSGLIWKYQSVVQYIFFFFYIKWGLFLVAFYAVHKIDRRLRNLFYLIVLIEFLLSLVSYFASSFLNIIFFMLIGLITIQPKLNLRSYFFLLIFGVFIFHIGVLWTAVKGDYRSFISGGTTAQTVTVSRNESFNKLIDLLKNVDDTKYKAAIEQTIDRLGYIQFFAASLDYVPRVVPYQNGQIYLEAVEHYLVPRFLNPNKAVLDDSKHVNQYTGLRVTTSEGGASFSLGYVADAYIDFGPVFMFTVIFAFGYLCGIFYNYLFKRSPNQVWVWIFTGPFFLLINVYGADTKKALGFILIYFITVAVLKNFLIKRVDPFIRA